jgi:ABC-2 type transport system ATP-binding protein
MRLGGVRVSTVPIVSVDNVGVRFGRFAALQDVAFTVGKGSITGLVGPNGAGKTTLLRVLATLLLPTTGRAAVLGRDVVRQAHEVRSLIGYLPDSAGTYQDMRVDEYLKFFADAHGLDRKGYEAFRNQALELSSLEERSRDFVENLSRGMRAKLSFVRALAGNPKLLILDEPLSNLDPVARSEMLKILDRLRSEERTILVSSHILTDLEKVCDSVLFLDRGRLISEPSPDDEVVTYEIRVSAAPGDVVDRLSGLEGVASASKTHEEDRFILQLESAADVSAVLATVVASGLEVLEWKRASASLEERLVKAVTGGGS